MKPEIPKQKIKAPPCKEPSKEQYNMIHTLSELPSGKLPKKK